MIDDAFKNMSSNFEANFQDVITRSLNKLTSSGLSHDEDVDNLPDNEQNLGVPGPPPVFLFGNAFEVLQQNRSYTDSVWVKKYGRFIGYYQGTRPTLLVTDAELIKKILVKDSKHFMNRQKLNFYHEMWNENMFNAFDEKWKKIRSVTSPAFTTGKLRAMHPLMTKCIDKLELYFDSLLIGNSFVTINDFKDAISGFTVDVIASTSFATDIDSNGKIESPFVQNGKKLFDINRLRALVCFVFPKFLIQLLNVKTFFPPTPFNFFINLSQEIVKQRKRGEVKRNDFVQLLLDSAIDESQLANLDYNKLTMEIIAQCFLFFVAGFDTTATSIVNLLYILAKNPTVQEKLYQEIITNTANISDNHSTEYYDKVVNDLPYLEATIKETLRMYPPFTVLFRRVGTDGYKLNGVLLPKDMLVEVSNWVVHYDPEYFPEPLKFDPDRFLPENKHLIVPYSYLPFGDGPRNCVGMRFAIQEMKLMTARVLTKYCFEKANETPEELTFQKGSPLLSPKTFPLQIRKR
ncbi:PREDICTED: cytochrome P450 3A8-like [Rhagoletis zephyria]|uniref:cytochrome P450 3A8-like n=1 Tax=Rhagoletis zephyria TaxID=28612 RepID=UPI00081161F1|nr:PREDICTED: cytochrome P450 3A8-like [Rhagoletis zephyria]